MHIIWKEIAVYTILSIWLLLTIAYSVFNKRMAKFTARWDIFRWLTSYQMFSGTPRQFSLYYRDRTTSGQLSAWQQIPLTSPLKWYHACWYPYRITRSTIMSVVDDLAVQVTSLTDAETEKTVQQRVIYKIIVNYINRTPAGNTVQERQFKIEEDLLGINTAPASREVYVSAFFRV